MNRHRDVVTYQTKTRERVRDLAEVYTNEREVNAMLDLLPGMFPSVDRPRELGRTFLEPACGSGNFLVTILERKLAYVRRPYFRSSTTIEAAALKALSSIYGIDIDQSNVDSSRGFLKADLLHHMNLVLNTEALSEGFVPAVDAILEANIIRADTLKDAQTIRLVEYHWERKTGYVRREWSFLVEPDTQLDLFSEDCGGTTRDVVAIHYSLLADTPEPGAEQNRAGGVA